MNEPLVPQQELIAIKLPSGEAFLVMLPRELVQRARERAGELGCESLSEYITGLIGRDLGTRLGGSA